MSVNAYTARDLPVVHTNQPKKVSFEDDMEKYQQSTQIRTRLDQFQDDFSKDGFYKIVAVADHNKDKSEATVILEGRETRTKWAMFKDWCSHKIGNFTDRDKDKFDSAKIVVNAIRDELIRLYPEASSRRINEGTQAFVNKVSGGAVSVYHNDYTGKETSKNKPIETSYTSKYPHAFNAHEMVLANNMLHNATVIGLPHLGVATVNQ